LEEIKYLLRLVHCVVKESGGRDNDKEHCWEFIKFNFVIAEDYIANGGPQDPAYMTLRRNLRGCRSRGSKKATSDAADAVIIVT
jgi:hypothetical protein